LPDFNAKSDRLASCVLNACTNRLIFLLTFLRNMNFDLRGRTQRKKTENHSGKNNSCHGGSVTQSGGRVRSRERGDECTMGLSSGPG
jgi:hypothetical protein